MSSLIRFLPYAKYGIIVLGLIFLLYGIYDAGHFNGSNEQKVKCDEIVRLIEKSVHDANMIELERANKQLESYNNALIIRNEQYNELKATRRRQDKKLKELKDDNKDWANQPIPNDIINWLHN